MMGTLKTYAKRLYRTCTASTKRRALYAVPASVFFFLYGTMFLGGVAIGANASVTDKSIEQIRTTISASRFEMWVAFADEGFISKVLFGLVYPLIGSVYEVGIAGLHLGYAIPELGYLVEGLNLLWPVMGLAFVGMQFIRFGTVYTE